MPIQLNTEQERLIGQAIQAGLIGKADDAVTVGVEALGCRDSRTMRTTSCSFLMPSLFALASP